MYMHIIIIIIGDVLFRDFWRRGQDIEQLLLNTRSELTKYERDLSASMGKVLVLLLLLLLLLL